MDAGPVGRAGGGREDPVTRARPVSLALLAFAAPCLCARAEEEAPAAVLQPSSLVVAGASARESASEPLRALARMWREAEDRTREIEALAREVGEAEQALRGAGTGASESRAVRAERLRERRDVLNAAMRRVSDTTTLFPAHEARIESARKAAGLPARPEPGFTIAAQAVSDVFLLAEKATEANRKEEVRAIADDWRALRALGSLDEEAVPVAARLDALLQEFEAREDLERMRLRVTGVLVDEKDPAQSLALVNGYLLRAGEEIRPEREAVVAAIETDRLWIRFRGHLFALGTQLGR
jgi:hypothetical protein